jgi:hypothetical protein
MRICQLFLGKKWDVAKSRRKLFPVMITKCELPYGFRGYQTIDLTLWRGDSNAPMWKRLIKDIRRKFGTAGVAQE